MSADKDVSSNALCTNDSPNHNWDSWYPVDEDTVSPHPVTGKYYFFMRMCQNMGCCERELANDVVAVGDTFRFDSDAVRARGGK